MQLEGLGLAAGCREEHTVNAGINKARVELCRGTVLLPSMDKVVVSQMPKFCFLQSSVTGLVKRMHEGTLIVVIAIVCD